jgi:outer membrane protein assembly factor BamB
MLPLIHTLAAMLSLGAGTETPWLEFRGPNGTGLYNGPKVPTEWGMEKNVTWKTKIPGSGWSSPIVLKGKLILTTAVPVGMGAKPDYELRVLCIDAATGGIDWNELVFLEEGSKAPGIHKKNGHASPTAISDGERIVVHFGHMGTAAYDLKGKALWKNQKHPYIPLHGNGGSPILVGKNVVFCCDGTDTQFVLALDIKTGEQVWKTDRKTPAKMKFSFSTSQLIEHDGKQLIISPASDICAAYDPKTGAEVWRLKYPISGWSLICRPVYAHGLIYFSTGYMTQQMLAVKPDGTGDITAKNIAWTGKKFAPNTPTPLIVGDELYTISDSGTMSCYDAKTGEVHWAERIKGGAFSSSPILADGKIFITSETGHGLVIEPSTKELKVLAESDLEEKTFATIVPANGSLFIRTESQLYRFDEKK